MKILGIDSSGMVASVAMVQDDIMVAEYSVNYKKTHSQTLMLMLDEIVKMTEQDLNEIDAIAVAAGPGSFTGLRIGSATVKGLGMALEKPIISVPTCHALAYNLWGIGGLVCPIMDARRGEVYAAVYHKGEKVMEDTPIALSELLKKLDYEKILFLGDGVPVHREFIKNELGDRAEFECEQNNFGSAAAVIKAGIKEMNKNGTVDYNNLNPVYLRVSQAERLKK